MRLTETRVPKYFNCKEDVCGEDCIQKLGQLEDIEEELGIDLIILFKALKKGCYVKKTFTGEIVLQKPCIYENNLIFLGTANCLIKDYGKTWALTKEELL